MVSREPGAPDESILAKLGALGAVRLGEGGEAVVYALDADRAARVHRPAATRQRVSCRSALLTELRASADRVPFAIPEVIEECEIEGRFVTIERRLPGQAMAAALRTLEGGERRALVRSYLDAASEIQRLAIERPWYGDLCAPRSTRRFSWRSYLEARAAASLRRVGPDFAAIDPAALAGALPDCDRPTLVHLDVFPGNVLTVGGAVTSVIDFGAVSLRGDPRLDPLLAVVYLQAPMSPTARDEDRAVAMSWLRERELDGWYDAAERWTASYWLPAEGELHRWARKVLLRSPPDAL